MSISAIIVNYYTSSLLPDSIDDLISHTEIEKIYIVDNSGEVNLSNDLPKVKVIKPGKNVGFGAGVNLAAQEVQSEFLLVLNPDVRLLPNCIDNLLIVARESDSVLTCPRFYWDHEKKFKLPPGQGTSAWFDFALSISGSNCLEFEHISFYWQIRHERFWEKKEPFIEIFISGACILINKEWVFKDNNSVFDQRFFLYFEDTDISLRAFNDGFPPLCVPSAQACHYYDKSPEPEKGKLNLMTNSHYEFVKKYYPDIKYSFETTSDFQPDIDDLGCISSPPEFNLQNLSIKGDLYFEIGVNPVFVPFAQADICYHSPLSTNGKKSNSIIKPSSFLNIDNNKDKDLADDTEDSLIKKDQVDKFILPDTIWKQLASGVYYSRIRDTIKGTLKTCRWEKK